MGTDNFFHKKRARLDERKKESLTPKPNSFLIVSEGKKTEPLYFDGLADYINTKYGSSVNVEKPIIDTCGEGKCTVSLVEKTTEIVARARILYSQVWVVFDKDDFNDFDEAISLCNSLGYKAAWSNQSFEYWIYLHFHYSDSALHRDGWVDKLSNIYKSYEINENGYLKNDANIFNIATTKGSLKAAISNAYRINQTYENISVPSKCDPCTTVHLLVNELKPYIEDLL